MKPVTQMLQEAKSVEDVREILNYANWTKPPGDVRRRFLKVAKHRIQELEQQSGLQQQ